MCIILQRFYTCRTRNGDYVDTEQERAASENGESHYPGRFLVRCSTPLMVPDLNETVTDVNILPCYGAWDVKVERYNHPCPDCRGEPPYLQDPPPKERWHFFSKDTDAYARSIDSKGDILMRRVTERTAESLAKTIYCWVDMHGSSDLMSPQSVKAPDMAKEIISTCHDVLCLEHPSHGSPLNIYPSSPKCTCPLNETPYQHNVATAMRLWMNYQTTTGHEHLMEWAEFTYAQRNFAFDLFDHWTAVPQSVWARNPFFEFVPTETEPDISKGESLDRVEYGQGPLFGLEAALQCSWSRVERMRTWESWQDPALLSYCEPLTKEVTAVRLVGLHTQIAEAMRHHRRWRGWWLCSFVLEKIASILAHDSGLVDYRIRLTMDHILHAFNRVANDPPAPVPAGPVSRPPFKPPYVDALFNLIMTNPAEFSKYPLTGGELDMILRENVDNDEAMPFPHWVVPDSPEARDARIETWYDDYWATIRKMKIKATMIDDHTVKYIPGLITDFCTSCKRPTGRESRGSQLCRRCKVRSGFKGRLGTFGDKTFLRKVEEGAGPMDSWNCYICFKDFNNNEPPFEVPTETIRCHAVRHTVAGSACLRMELLGKGEKMTGLPRCPMDRQALCEWDHNIFEKQEDKNDDDMMDPWAFYSFYGIDSYPRF